MLPELTNTHDIELEATLQQLPLDLRGNAVETNMAAGKDRGRSGRCRACCSCHSGDETRVRGVSRNWSVESWVDFVFRGGGLAKRQGRNERVRMEPIDEDSAEGMTRRESLSDLLLTLRCQSVWRRREASRLGPFNCMLSRRSGGR